MRGDTNPNDTPTGAVLRRNIMALIETSGRTPREVYEALGWTADRFWRQFSGRVDGPGVVFVADVSEALQVPRWRLLLREGEFGPQQRPEPPPYADPTAKRPVLNLQDARDFLRHWPGLAQGVPKTTTAREPEINLLVRQNTAIGCYVAEIDRQELHRRLDVTRGTWWAWFRRKTGITLGRVWEIARVLEMQPWELLAPVVWSFQPVGGGA